MDTGDKDAPAPSAEQPGDEDAPAPSAELDGQSTDDEPAETMLDAITGDLEDQFGPVSEDPEHQETQGPDTTDVSDPNTVQDPKSEQSSDETPAAEASEKDAAQSDEDQDDNLPLPDEVTEAELANYSRRAGKRVQNLLRQRIELRNEVDQFRPIQEQIQSQGLGDEDVQMALGLAGALQRGDFQGFLDGVAPMVQAAQQYMGQSLPAELQSQVEQGFITPELASQMAASQAQTAWSASQMQRQQQQHAAQMQQHQEQQAERAQQQVRQVIGQSVESWESQTRQADPDFAQKEPMIRRMAQALVAERGIPQTAEQALQIAQDAYAEANQFVVRPAPQATRNAPDAGIGSRNATPEPRTLEEAVRQGLLNANSA